MATVQGGHFWTPIPQLRGSKLHAELHGKTSFARIHARALNCDDPNQAGSPCGACRPCQMPAAEVMIEINAASAEAREKYVAAMLQGWNRKPVDCRFRVIFFDEAHNLPAGTQQLLLKPVEEPAPGIVFIFATTEPHGLTAALRSRLQLIRIEPFSSAVALDLLEYVGRRKNLSFDREALSLVAAAKPYPRDMIIGLQQLSEYGRHIDVQLVKDVLDLSICDHLENYMLALASGDRWAQVRAMHDWSDEETIKARWVRLFLLTVYYNEVLGQRVVADALCYGMHRTRASFVQSLAKRHQIADKAALATFVESMLVFWSERGSEEPAKLKLTFALFGAVCSGGADFSGVVSRSDGNDARFQPASTPEISTNIMATDIFPLSEDDGFITREEVREIVNRASFLTQHHASFFNISMHIEVPDSRGMMDTDAIAIVRSRCQVLLTAFAADKPVASILQLENDSGAIVARLVACHAVDDTDRASSCIRKWCEETEAMGLIVHVREAPERDSGEFHWSAVRELCAGFCEDAAVPVQQTLRAALRISRNDRRSPSPIRGARLIFSGQVSGTEIAIACANEMKPLSAFDAKAWKQLYSGWEEFEHVDRMAEVAVRSE
ncbi:AAA family ATPase, partial [Bradyrhizobium sp.]|uniref:AAA family ATPase n=1 Tax=Bradyrhizobium sp. TaxID=376 RepID=UPI0035A0FD65